ncbi:flagellar protein FlaG [Virgibacillus flavescens]|uniref:flagellar protein FlaG n=1 Tax=Virgibacillus flavescens TaxID=1611422 RepID=UPI003D336816
MRLEKVATGSHPLQSETHIKPKSSAAEGTMEKEVQSKNIVLHDQEVINREDIETVISNLNEFIEPLQTNLKFEFHDKLNEYYVTVINPITEEVIREIPSRKMLDMYAAMAEVMGLFVDEKI